MLRSGFVRFAALVGMFGAVACSSLRASERNNGGAATVRTSEDQRQRAKADPAWVMVYDATDLNGDEVSPVIEAHALTVVIVFASWCEECQQEIGVLAALGEQDPRVGIIGLNAMEEQGGKSDDAKLRAYVKDHASWLHVVKADDQVLQAIGGVKEIPSVFVFDADGKRIATYQHTERKPPQLQELQDTVSNALLPPAAAAPPAATQPAGTQP